MLANPVIETWTVTRIGGRPVEPAAATGTGSSAPARIGVITFPGTLDDVDAARAVTAVGAECVAALARRRRPARRRRSGGAWRFLLRRLPAGRRHRLAGAGDAAVIDGARGGLPVLGICNGFQVLCEAGLLPGALLRNAGLRFVCRDQ